MATANSFNSPINIRLPLTPETQNPELFARLAEVYNAIRQLQLGVGTLTGAVGADPSAYSTTSPSESIFPQNANRLYGKALADLSPGQMISITVDAGVVAFQKANASNATKFASAYVSSSPILSGAYGEVIMKQGLCPFIGGLTIGTLYYLSTTDGLITATPPSASGNIVQPIGVALTTSNLYFNPSWAYSTIP